ncbi:hypothetical protein Dimus_022691, partial [Dionaea muscipula]
GVDPVRGHSKDSVGGLGNSSDADSAAWKLVKGKSTSQRPTPPLGLISTSRFSPLDPGNCVGLSEFVLVDVLGGILVPAVGAIT